MKDAWLLRVVQFRCNLFLIFNLLVQSFKEYTYYIKQQYVAIRV